MDSGLPRISSFMRWPFASSMVVVTWRLGTFIFPLKWPEILWSTVFLAHYNLIGASTFEQASEEQDPVSAN